MNIVESEKQFRKRLAAAESMAVRSRNYRRARERALTALARIHKEEYFELLEQEKAKDEQEGKRWNDLTGNLPNNRANNSGSSNTNRGDTSAHTQNESDNV